MFHRTVVLILVIATGAMLASCGGDSESSGKKPGKRAAKKTQPAAAKKPGSKYGPKDGMVDLGNPATIRGVVRFKGTPPARTKLDLSKDKWCEQHGNVLSEEVVVGEGGGLKGVVVYLKDLDDHASEFEAPSEPAKLVQKGCQYHPHVLALRAGQELEVVNADDNSHNFHFVGRRNDEINRTQPEPATDIVVLESPELGAQFTCDIHPWMKAKAHIFAHPCFAVSGDDGSFEIKGVPPGNYRVGFKHESCKTDQTSLEVMVGPGANKDVGEIAFKPKP